MMTTPNPTGEIHEAAAVFPMLPDDELKELAEDIKANGLIHPIVLDEDGTIIDGRNRLAACRMAGVEPRYTSLNGHDPSRYVLSANIRRRNLNKGQQAMAVVLVNSLETNEFGTKQRLADELGVSRTRISQASTVMHYAPELADGVMVGTISLDDAYSEAKQEKEAQESREERMQEAVRDLALLRTKAPKLADAVDEEHMSLQEALDVWRERERLQKEQQENLSRNFANAILMTWSCLIPEPERIAEWWVKGLPLWQRDDFKAHEHLFTSEGIRTVAASLEELAAAVDVHHKGVLK